MWYYCIGLVVIQIIILIAGYFIFQKRKSEYSGIISKILLIGIATVLTYVIPYIFPYYSIGNICYNIYFISFEILMYFTFQFFVFYTTREHIGKKVNMFCLGLISINVLLFLLNYFRQVVFSLSFDMQKQTWIFEYKWLFLIHLTFSYFLCVRVTYAIVKKMLTSASIYRKIYYPILFQIVIAVAINLYQFIERISFPISLPLYATTNMIMCYYALSATSREIIDSTIVKLCEDMHHSIFCFDLRGKCIYANSYALNKLGVPYDDMIEEAEHHFMNWSTQMKKNLPDYYQSIIPMIICGENRQMELEFHKITDKKNVVTGYFIKLDDHTEIIDELKTKQYHATHDHLTDLYKRDTFFAEANTIMKQNADKKWYIICSDITNFKLINDFYGEEIGDKLLKNQAKYIKTLCNDYCIAGRIISDRFAILMSEQQFDAQILEREVGQMKVIDESIPYQVRVVFGVYEVEDIHENVRTMCDKAYMALRTIQDDYHKHVVYYNRKMLDHMVYEKQILEDLTNSIESNLFTIFFQPQANNQGQIVGAEALVRWNHPTLGLLFPDQFIKIFEKTGMIYKLDYYVWEKAAQKLSEWKKNGFTDMSISVNISAKDFYYADLANVFLQFVDKYDIDSKNLHLEITESVPFYESDIYYNTLTKLRSYGFLVEIDDFGSGYSSLYRVQNLCADLLKIDMMFLSKTINAKKSEQILCSIIQMAKKLNMKVIIEGVEDKQQFERLVQLNADYFQGYYFSIPIRVDEFEMRYLVNK